jgi:tRNA (guanine37-N1)-methyltransferase
LLLLQPEISASSVDALPDKIKTFAATNGVTEVLQHSIELDYSYWTTEQILTSILPQGIAVPGAFEVIGHIGITP